MLQTRIVSNAQVMAEWDLWKPSTEAEVGGLIREKEALETSTQAKLDQLQASGHKVTLIPSKVIYSLKAPCGRRKCRLVACGNFLGASEDNRHEHKRAVYTASIGIESLRTGLSYSTRRRHTILTVDIKAAFLNAQLLPRDRQQAEAVAGASASGDTGPSVASTGEADSETVALIPPRMLITKGFFSPSARLVVQKAVYGLDQSPRDWAFMRDSQFPQMIVRCEGHNYKFYQSFAEDNMWLISTQAGVRGNSE